MFYTNILNNGDLVLSNDKLFDKKTLKAELESFLNKSDYQVVQWTKQNGTPFELIVKDSDNNLIFLALYLKNITGAGWSNKPNIKRVQVSNVRKVAPEDVYETTDYQTVLILGYYNFDNSPLMVAWNAYRYMNHSTVRSCYIDIKGLEKGYKMRYFYGTFSKQKIWVFNSYNFGRFFKEYIEINK